jgi:hypothetical protein
MFTKSRKSMLSWADSRVLIYSTLFLLCALISALGASSFGVAVFLPCAVAIEFVLRTRCDVEEGDG